MGRPTHYSSEIPIRCQALIAMLRDKVQEESDPDGRWGGPLRTTFLVAMATPMVVLPIERHLPRMKPWSRTVFPLFPGWTLPLSVTACSPSCSARTTSAWMT